eukprot:CAMPEP_0172510778 /NCGR_PEP_ID=MMETSP1066-20121228/231252_1 /TAXON_ID=671091 /ORGANISM="Coscinodiscus wailesii, Strain CCMP2513" /LENGTH=244 /DNA_ID=CAMNT_0013289903 /DNA_START=92 /DNA_END=826 /DNA_ORIENTATION=+
MIVSIEARKNLPPLLLLLLTLLLTIIPKTNCWIHPPVILTRRHTTQTTIPSSTLSMNKPPKKQTRQKRIINELVNFIEETPPNSIDPAGYPSTPPEDDEPLATFVRSLASAADARKAEDIRAIRVSKITAVTSFILLVSGNSRPQNQAISVAIMKEAEEGHGRTLRNGGGKAEGTADSGWILLDFGDVIVHVMTPRSRLFYDIEGRWKEGEDMDLSEVLVPNSVDGGGGDGGDGLEEEDDPFWS